MAAAEFTVVRGSNTIITCHDAGKLNKTLKKVWHAMAFLDRETQGGMAKNKQIKNTDLEKTSGAFIMDHGTKIPSGWQSTVLGIVADDPQKIRGDRADFLIYDESGCHAPGTEVIMSNGKLKKVEDIVVGDLVMGDDGTPRKILELHHGFLQMYKIIPVTGDALIVNANHILYGKKKILNSLKWEPFEIKTEDYYNMIPSKKDEYKLIRSNTVNLPHLDVPIDPYVFGMQLSDSSNKCIQDCYLYNDRETLLQLLAGLIDSSRCYNVKLNIVEFNLCKDSKPLVDQVEFICRSLGMQVSRDSEQSRLKILSGYNLIPSKLYRELFTLVDNSLSKDSLDSSFTVEKLEVGEYYGFSLDGNLLFLLKDFTVCHNSWPSLETAVTLGEALVEIGGVRFGVMVFGGTGGDSGPALEGLRKIYYNPREQNVLPYKHHYTESGEVEETGFFIPAFLQMYDHLDSRGWCDPEITKPALQEKRLTKINNPKAYLEHCAEYCWTASEAFAQEGSNKFNKVLIAEQLTRIRALKVGPRPVAGRLMPVYKNDQCKFKEIEKFNWIPDLNSKLQILEHPIWSDLFKEQLNKERDAALKEGRKFEEESQVYDEMRDLYVAGVDGIDIGASQTSKLTKDPSDFCIVIMKRAFGLQLPLIVAMYKDRPLDVNSAYKIAMCLCKYYNARINVEATRVGFLNWAKREGLLHYFMRRPRATLNDIRSGNTKSYGTPATGAIIEMQTDLIATYVEDYSQMIWFEEILDELLKYNPENKRKYDIVAAFGMLMLADQELSARVPIKVESETSGDFQDFGYWRDSKGYLHKGIIPKKDNLGDIKYAEFRTDREAYDPFAIESSDPRYHSLFVQEGLYRTNIYLGLRPSRL